MVKFHLLIPNYWRWWILVPRPYFLQSSQYILSFFFSWRRIYYFCASWMQPLPMCCTLLVAFQHGLRNGTFLRFSLQGLVPLYFHLLWLLPLLIPWYGDVYQHSFMAAFLNKCNIRAIILDANDGGKCSAHSRPYFMCSSQCILKTISSCCHLYSLSAS